MNKRPRSVTVIAGLFIAVSVGDTISAVYYYGQPEITQRMGEHLLPVWAQYGIGCVIDVTYLLAGMGMLRGQNWARWLYFLSVPFFQLIGFANDFKLAISIPSLLVNGYLIFLLTRPRVQAYFTGAPPTRTTLETEA